MTSNLPKEIAKFYLLGINHKIAPIEVRERFYVNDKAQSAIHEKAKSLEIEALTVISTCNRTEIYAVTDKQESIPRLLTEFTSGTQKELNNFSYQLSGDKAIRHLFDVSAGIDSQIIGDFQVVGQVRDAYKVAEKAGVLNPFMKRLFANVFQTAKLIKNETDLSKGAASIAHAAVQHIKNTQENLEETNFLLFGLGNVGKIACVNLLNHMQNRSLVLINRTNEKAKDLAKKFNIIYKNACSLPEEVAKADVIVVATGAEKPTLLRSHFNGSLSKKLVLDLSVPRNVDSKIKEIEGVNLVCLDQLSQQNDIAVIKRKQSIPKAKEIINERVNEFYDWLKIRNFSPIFQKLQNGLLQLKNNELAYHKNNMTEEELKKADLIATKLMNKISRMTINHIRKNFKSQSSSINTISEIFHYKHPTIKK